MNFDFEISRVDCTEINSSGQTVQIQMICIFHGFEVSVKKSVTRVTVRHHEACRVMLNSDPE